VGAICAITAAVVFSTGGLLVRQIDLPAWDVSFWRSALMIITILPLLIWRRREAWIDARNAGGALFASAIGIAGSMVAFILALGLAPVANVLIVFGATPFITALAARLVLGEPLHGHTLFAMAAAIVGLAMSVAGSLAAGALAGMALAFVVVLCMSANYVIVRPGCWRWGRASSPAASSSTWRHSSAFRPAARPCLACWSSSWARSGCGQSTGRSRAT
jgi:drug/metabolite transporter (DMT)-like permease